MCVCVCDPKMFARLIPYFFGDQIPSNQMLANSYKFKQWLQRVLHFQEVEKREVVKAARIIDILEISGPNCLMLQCFLKFLVIPFQNPIIRSMCI